MAIKAARARGATRASGTTCDHGGFSSDDGIRFASMIQKMDERAKA